ncbi:hypothetical protein [Roseivivax lentus]|uniref:hypothetical protein n=1 Tax=Roseivivax lentus TaxID=633194 RepID=UPI00097080CA|nr:hypothetical protein [Roseivivax lentus]
MLIEDAEARERLTRVDTEIVDKPGTLIEGQPRQSTIHLQQALRPSGLLWLNPCPFLCGKTTRAVGADLSFSRRRLNSPHATEVRIRASARIAAFALFANLDIGLPTILRTKRP